MLKLVALFTLVPLLELFLLLWLGSVMGFWPTVAMVLVTGLLGAWLAKKEGLRVFRRWQEALAHGQLPEEGVLSGLLVLVGGVLLVTPGVLTDVTGLLLLLPATRRRIADVLRARAQRAIDAGSVRVVSYHASTMRGAPFARAWGRGDVIDVEGEEIAAEEPRQLH